MKYSIDDIAKMRRAVVTLTGSEGAEDRLRTYMQNETTVAELEAAAAREEAIRMDEQMMRQRQFVSDEYYRQLREAHAPQRTWLLG